MDKKTSPKKKICATISAVVSAFNLNLSGGVKMAIIATVSSIGTMIMATAFSLWMIKQLFSKE